MKTARLFLWNFQIQKKNKSVQLLGGVKSLQVRTDLEVDLKRTQSYCMEYVIGPVSTLNDYLNTVLF